MSHETWLLNTLAKNAADICAHFVWGYLNAMTFMVTIHLPLSIPYKALLIGTLILNVSSLVKYKFFANPVIRTKRASRTIRDGRKYSV